MLFSRAKVRSFKDASRSPSDSLRTLPDRGEPDTLLGGVELRLLPVFGLDVRVRDVLRSRRRNEAGGVPLREPPRREMLPVGVLTIGVALAGVFTAFYSHIYARYNVFL